MPLRIRGEGLLAGFAWVAYVRDTHAHSQKRRLESVAGICERCPRAFLEDEVGRFGMGGICERCPRSIM